MGVGITPFGSDQSPEEPFIPIPFDYFQLPPEERNSIVPICIRKADRQGQPIAWRWFSDGVVPVADGLRSLARWMLGDIWRVSELTEATVHSLWNTHGENMGPWPSRRVYADAKWRLKICA